MFKKTINVETDLYTAAFIKQLALKLREREKDPWPKTIGIDEHGLFKDKKRGAREFATVFVDYQNKRVKEIVEEKSHVSLKQGIAYIEGSAKNASKKWIKTRCL